MRTSKFIKFDRIVFPFFYIIYSTRISLACTLKLCDLHRFLIHLVEDPDVCQSSICWHVDFLWDFIRVPNKVLIRTRWQSSSLWLRRWKLVTLWKTTVQTSRYRE